MKLITLPDYEQRLKLHNWKYQSEQCASVWKDGQVEYSRLIDISSQGTEHRKLFEYYKEKNSLTK